jgi:hypothetical protein
MDNSTSPANATQPTGGGGTAGDLLNATLQAAAALLAAQQAAAAAQQQAQQQLTAQAPSPDLLYITDNRVTDSQLTTS